jgi:hypothetical protein
MVTDGALLLTQADRANAQAATIEAVLSGMRTIFQIDILIMSRRLTGVHCDNAKTGTSSINSF